MTYFVTFLHHIAYRDLPFDSPVNGQLTVYKGHIAYCDIPFDPPVNGFFRET